MTDYHQMEQVFEQAGLATPPIPEHFRERIRSYGPWLFGTRQLDRMKMYSTYPYLEEVLKGDGEDYVGVSHAGHGINSYSINYQLLLGPLAILAQTAWGGGYMDNSRQAEALTAQVEQCRGLIEDAEHGRVEGILRPPGRLIVCESDFRSDICRWGWIDKPIKDANLSWKQVLKKSSEPLAQARQWISDQEPGQPR